MQILRWRVLAPYQHLLINIRNINHNAQTNFTNNRFIKLLLVTIVKVIAITLLILIILFSIRTLLKHRWKMLPTDQ